VFLLEEGPWHQPFLGNLANHHNPLLTPHIDNFSFINVMFTLAELVKSYVSRAKSWSLDHNKLQGWLVGMMMMNYKHIINMFIQTDLVLSHINRINSLKLDNNKFQKWCITMMYYNETIAIKTLRYKVLSNTNLRIRSTYYNHNSKVSYFSKKILMLLTSTLSIKTMILWGSTLGVWRQGNDCEIDQQFLMPITLQSGCRQAVSRMFWYKGKEVYTRPSRKPYFSCEFLEAAAKILQEDEHAPATKSAFNSKVKTFFTFVSEIGLTDLPPDGHEMVIYATWLTLSGHCSTAGSLRQYLSAVKVLC
jgi:hypothetical protein